MFVSEAFPASLIWYSCGTKLLFIHTYIHTYMLLCIHTYMLYGYNMRRLWNIGYTRPVKRRLPLILNCTFSWWCDCKATFTVTDHPFSQLVLTVHMGNSWESTAYHISDSCAELLMLGSRAGVKGGLPLPSLQTNWSGLIIQAIIPLLSIDLCIDKNIVKNKIKLPGPLAYHANALYTSGLQLLPLIAQVNKESQSRVHQIPSCDLTLILPVMHHTVQYTVTELVALCSNTRPSNCIIASVCGRACTA